MLTSNRQPGHIVQRPGQRADQRHYHTHNAKHHRTGAVVGDNVEGDGKGDKMAGHEKDDEEQLADS